MPSIQRVPPSGPILSENAITYSAPAIGADGTIYMGSYDHNLYALDSNGVPKWSYHTGEAIDYSCPAIGADGTIYVGSNDGKLYAIYSSSPDLASSPWPMFHHDLTHTGVVPLPVLTVTTSGTGAGTVTSSPPGIDCGSTCNASYTKNAKVILTPLPESGSIFTKWSGNCKGTGTCAVTMSANRSVGAEFEPGSCTYTITPKAKTLSYTGGTVTVGITAKGSTSCPVPDISHEGDWFTLTSTFYRTEGTITLTIPEYDYATPQNGTVTIGGEPLFTITQHGKPCTLGLSASSSALLPGNDPNQESFTVNATPTDCVWRATPSKASTWITITSGTTGTGTQDVRYTVTENTGKSMRSGKISVVTTLNKKSKSYTVKQANE